MKNLCKIFRKVWQLGYLAAFLLLWGCGDSADSGNEVTVYPDNYLNYWMYPNDMAKNDSAAANLAHGVILLVHPNASYELSFDVDPTAEAPTMQLFRLYSDANKVNTKMRKVRTLKPKEVDGRYVYSFVCEENELSYWAVSLVEDDHFYEGTVQNVRFLGEGAYSDHLSLNLVLVGNVEENLNGFTVEDLSRELLNSFRKYYSSVVIDTLYVNRSGEHPTLGAKFPNNRPWVASDDSPEGMMFHEFGNWPSAVEALDIVLVHYIDIYGVLGYSDLFGGNLKGGKRSTVVLGANVKEYGGATPSTLAVIVQTALHETGHFFGLRHTTATSDDLSAFNDYSNIDDGFSDTPVCAGLRKKAMAKEGVGRATDIRVRLRNTRLPDIAGNNLASNIQSLCPDVLNTMFPLDVNQVYGGFSGQQLATLRANLMIFPH